MNYEKIYYNIIKNRRNNPLEGYTECHHIKPQCLGGSNDKDNLVNLSAREHFLCHFLLYKMYCNTIYKFKLLNAFMMMRVSSKNQDRYINSRLYENIKIEYSKYKSIEQSGEGNSQFNTIWIYNTELKECKKISKDDEIPFEWFLGRILNFDNRSKKLRKKKIKSIVNKVRFNLNNENKIKLFTKYYEYYKQFGFKGVVEKYNFSGSPASLVKKFKRFVKDYKSFEIYKYKIY